MLSQELQSRQIETDSALTGVKEQTDRDRQCSHRVKEQTDQTDSALTGVKEQTDRDRQCSHRSYRADRSRQTVLSQELQSRQIETDSALTGVCSNICLTGDNLHILLHPQYVESSRGERDSQQLSGRWVPLQSTQTHSYRYMSLYF